MKKNSKRILLLVILMTYFIICFINSNNISLELYNYTLVFIKNVFPSTFLFLLLSYLLFQYNILFFISKVFKRKDFCFYIFSIFSGFPGGVIFLKESLERGDITISDANKMVLFTHFPNPIFLLYHTQKLFNNKQTAFVFYLIILISQFIVLLFSSCKKSFYYYKNDNTNFSNNLINCSLKVIRVIFTIYVTSVFFYLISYFINNCISFSKIIFVVISGIFDLTKGVLSTSLISNSCLKGILLLFFFVFGSIPIHIQIKSILSDTSITYKNFLKGRFISFLLSIIIWIIYSCCAITV